MAKLAHELSKDPKMGDEARDHIDMFLDTCLSFRMGILLPFAVIAAMIDDF